MKTCTSCKYFQHPECTHPKALLWIDHTTGQSHYKWAEFARNPWAHDGPFHRWGYWCGSEGKWHEDQPSSSPSSTEQLEKQFVDLLINRAGMSEEDAERFAKELIAVT